jgi:hypothetical protein
VGHKRNRVKGPQNLIHLPGLCLIGAQNQNPISPGLSRGGEPRASLYQFQPGLFQVYKLMYDRIHHK